MLVEGVDRAGQQQPVPHVAQDDPHQPELLGNTALAFILHIACGLWLVFMFCLLHCMYNMWFEPVELEQLIKVFFSDICLKHD